MSSLNPERQLAYGALQELRETRENPFVPTADIDMVWVLSAPGTYSTLTEDGVYTGDSPDRTVIDHGIGIVKQITGLRVGKSPQDVTKDDIEAHGPIFYYNGESEESQDYRWAQNKDLIEAAQSPDFPLPLSKMIIDTIDVANTPGQMVGITKWLAETGYRGKIVTVSIGAHNLRVGRYIEHYKAGFPEGVTFLEAPATQEHNPVGHTKREVDKVPLYWLAGDLASKSYFADTDPLEVF